MYNFFFFGYVLECQRRQDMRARKRERTRAALCHSFVFCLEGLLPSLIHKAAWCEPLCEGARHRSPRPVKHCSHFPIVAGHEERYSRAKESFQFTLGLCLCLHNCACLLWVEIRQCALNFNIPSLTELFNLLSCNGQNLFEFFPLFWASVTLILLIQLYKRIKLKATEVDVNVCCKIPFQIFFFFFILLLTTFDFQELLFF